MIKQILVLFCLIAITCAQQKRYDGYKLFEVKAKDKASFDVLVKLYQESTNYDFWTEPRGSHRSTDIMVPPTYQKIFIDLMEAFNIDHSIKIADVQSLIEKSRKNINNAVPFVKHPRGSTRDARYNLNWTSYSDYPIILEFIYELAAKYPQLMSVSTIGKTYLGNDILMVKISTGGTNKKSIVADAGIHAREWISPSYMTWMIRELVENYAAHPQYVDNLDWYLIPVLNPDGYRYTFEPNGDRLWRKNRNPNAGSPCIGTDNNRNYGYYWDMGGSSNLACSEVYHGGAPFNQLENIAARDAILSIPRGSGQVYIAFHSYQQDFIYPWSFTFDPADNKAELDALGQAVVKNITSVNGTPFVCDQSSNDLFIISGCSDDWAMSAVSDGGPGIPYAYTLEMRPGPDGAGYGFELPADQIMPNNLEIWAGVKVVADFIINGNKL